MVSSYICSNFVVVVVVHQVEKSSLNLQPTCYQDIRDFLFHILSDKDGKQNILREVLFLPSVDFLGAGKFNLEIPRRARNL